MSTSLYLEVITYKYCRKENTAMIIANEGKKNMEVRANFIEPRGCGCLTS